MPLVFNSVLSSCVILKFDTTNLCFYTDLGRVAEVCWI